VEKDQQEKYLNNLYIQAGQNLGLEVGGAYSLKANAIKQTTNLNELIAKEGITLKVGANILTIDGSGIHFNTANYDDNSGNGGVSSNAISMQDLNKPLYEKIRVVEVESNLVTQNDIGDELVYTAKVEKYENDQWSETTDLQKSQLLQLNWHFIKNNDEADTELLQDNPSDDDIEISRTD
jgi:type VI secretion system secreted protein VgrG